MQLGDGPSIYCDFDDYEDGEYGHPDEELCSPVSQVSVCSNASSGDWARPKWFKNKPKPTKGIRRYVSPEEIQDLRDEEMVCRMLRVPWQKRGPPQPLYEGYRYRAQKFRPTGGPEGKGRWGNSGKGKGKDAVEAYLRKFGDPPSVLRQHFAGGSSSSASSTKGKGKKSK